MLVALYGLRVYHSFKIFSHPHTLKNFSCHEGHAHNLSQPATSHTFLAFSQWHQSYSLPPFLGAVAVATRVCMCVCVLKSLR